MIYKTVMEFVYLMISHLIQDSYFISMSLHNVFLNVLQNYQKTTLQHLAFVFMSPLVFWVKPSILECGLQSDLHSFYRFALHFYNTVSHTMIGQTDGFWMGFLVRMIIYLKFLKPEINFLF